MWERLVVFVKYHNAVPLGFMVLFLSVSGALAASPEVREAASEAVVSSETKVKSIDNSFIVNTDLHAFTPTVQITDIREDDENYFIAYTLNTIDLADAAWGTVSRQKELTVAKESVRGKDLGLHVAKELGEVLDRQSEYLKEVQEKERKRGGTDKILATTYSGLIGKFLDPKEEVFPGYEPIVSERDSEGRDAASGTGGSGYAENPEGSKSVGNQQASVVTADTKQGTTPASGATNASTPTGATMKMTGNNPAKIPTNATGGGYSDNGVIVQDEKQMDLSYTTVVDGAMVVEVDIDTRKPGVHSVRYDAHDRDGNAMALVRTVIVYDRYKTKGPALTILGEEVASVPVGSDYADAGATAIDYDDGDITAKITTESTVDTKTEGTYSVKYNVTDSNGNTSTAARIVTVVSQQSSAVGQ